MDEFGVDEGAGPPVERGTKVTFALTDEAAEAFGARFWVYLVADRESLAQVTREIVRITGQAAVTR